MNNWNFGWRERRSFLNQAVSFTPLHYTIANYSTEAEINKKTEMKSFDEDIFTKIHSIPDPLKKNLADTVITGEMIQDDLPTPLENKEFYYEANIQPSLTENLESSNNSHRREFYPSLTGITSFLSNVFGTISGAMFRRPKSPVHQYYDDSCINHEMALSAWQVSNLADQNKIIVEQTSVVNDNMSNCRAAVAQCEDKINAVKNLLINKSVLQPKETKVRHRRPRRAFIEPKAVKQSLEEDITAENYISLANDEYVEYFAIPNNSEEVLCEVQAVRMKTEIKYERETPEIVQVLPDAVSKVETTLKVSESESVDVKQEVISSCEDKMAKLKAMLQQKRKKPTSTQVPTDLSQQQVKENIQKPIKTTKVIPIDKKQDKRFKNSHRVTDKRKKSNIKRNIQEDMTFANEIDSDEISSVENSPAKHSPLQRIPETVPMGPIQSDNEYFDEIKGRFHTASTDSDDSFQIVFTDSPKLSRFRRPSDCDSEDSFIVFEDSPDSCFTSNDVFGDSSDSDGEISDGDSELSDSGCAVDICKLSPNLSRTISDLTDDNLYNESAQKSIRDISNDEVDCAVAFADVAKELSPVKEESPECEERASTGLLIDEVKKLKRKDQPPKKVTFSEKPPKVHVMRVWAFAARQARAGHWERYTLDRDRFKRRIADVDMAISWVLKPQHRKRVMFQRFMPWWNKQKRIEAAEKKRQQEMEAFKKQYETVIQDEIYREIDQIQDFDNKYIEHLKVVADNSKTDDFEKGNPIKNLDFENIDNKMSSQNIENNNIVKNGTPIFIQSARFDVR